MKMKNKIQENILLFNLKTDADDDILGFTTDWINAFARKYRHVYVITMYKGVDNTLPNVSLFSVGKEKGYSEAKRVVEFYKIFFKLLKKQKLSKIFAHMAPEFAILAGPIARLKKIPLILWFAHKSTPVRLKLAYLFADKLFTPSKESCRLKNRKKIMITGHGINIEKFSKLNSSGSCDKFLSISRICAIKNIDKIILFFKEIVKKQNKNAKLTIIGKPFSGKDKKYLTYCKKLVKSNSLEEKVTFKGSIPYKNIHSEYHKADYFCNFSNTGSIDKSVLEAIVAGLIPITTNEAFKKYPFYYKDPAKFKIKTKTAAAKYQDLILKNSVENIIRQVIEI